MIKSIRVDFSEQDTVPDAWHAAPAIVEKTLSASAPGPDLEAASTHGGWLAHEDLPPMSYFERSLRYFFAIPLGLLGAFGMLGVFRITAAGESDMVGLIAIPSIVSLFSAFGIGNARSGLWLTISAIVGGLVLLLVTAAAFVLSAAIYSR